MNAPKSLADKGLSLWQEISGKYELRPDEHRLLEDACREADLIDRMESEIQGMPLTARGSQGQPVAAPLVTEIRQHRATLARMLGQLRLPVDEAATAGETAEDISAKARKAANARWSRVGKGA